MRVIKKQRGGKGWVSAKPPHETTREPWHTNKHRCNGKRAESQDRLCKLSSSRSVKGMRKTEK